MKYYLQQNCIENVPVRAGNYLIQFQQAEFFGGMWWGVFATDNPAHQEGLQKAIAERRQGVSEISEQDYLKTLKKKGQRQTNTWSVAEPVIGSKPSPTPPTTSPEGSAVSAPAEAEKAIQSPASEHKIDDLLQTAPRDAGTNKPGYVTSQRALAEVVGVSFNRMQEMLRREGNPGKGAEGYSVEAWEQFAIRTQ
jgi:hypothetical protein